MGVTSVIKYITFNSKILANDYINNRWWIISGLRDVGRSSYAPGVEPTDTGEHAPTLYVKWLSSVNKNGGWSHSSLVMMNNNPIWTPETCLEIWRTETSCIHLTSEVTWHHQMSEVTWQQLMSEVTWQHLISEVTWHHPMSEVTLNVKLEWWCHWTALVANKFRCLFQEFRGWKVARSSG